MFDWKEFEKIKKILSHVGGIHYMDKLGQHHLKVRPDELLDWIEFIKEDLGFLTLSEIAGFERSSECEVIYHLLNMGLHQRLNLHLIVSEGEVIPSVVKFFPHADWPEREQAEMLNLKFDTIKEALILPKKQKNYPLKKDAIISSWPKEEELPLPTLRMNPNKSEAPYPEESYKWKRFDLLSPVTMGNFEWSVCLDPMKVVDSSVRIGFHHQGLEKLFQNKNIFQLIHLVDKVNLSSAPHFSIAWAKTIEEMFRVKIPERAQAIRIVMLELGRVADHLTVLHLICQECGQEEHRHFLNAREKIYELFEKYTGFRQGVGVATIGGVKENLPQGWVVEYQNIHDSLSKNLRLVHHSLLSQPKFRQKLQGVAVNAQSVLKWGVSGPAMRAAGLNFDLRKSQPFYFYKDIDFDIPVGIHGSAYDRYLIRFEEIFQSFRIMTQVIDNLPMGDTITNVFDKNALELHEYFATLDFPNDWHYSALEAPSGEAGFLVKLNNDFTPARIKMKTPGYSLAGALPIFVKGLQESQLRANLASLGLSRWEMDR
jgi:NADH-quinone oxidoreductase subunit C/D